MVSVISVTTAGAVTREPTVHTRALTVAVHHLVDIRPHPYSPISNPRPATMAIVTPKPVDAMGTAAGQVTRESALGHARALQLKSSEIGIEIGNGSESAALMNSPQRNTNMSEPLATAAREGRGSALGRTTGRGNAATRANTTAAVGTRATAGTGVEIHQDHRLVKTKWMSDKTCGKLQIKAFLK